MHVCVAEFYLPQPYFLVVSDSIFTFLWEIEGCFMRPKSELRRIACPGNRSFYFLRKIGTVTP